MKLKFDPLTTATWKQFELLMGEKGGCGNCWCMYFRLPYKAFQENKPGGNKKEMKKLVTRGAPLGLIASAGKEPVGWIALAPREGYRKLENSRAFKRIDEKPVWSITCFFIRKEFRHKGLSRELIKGAVDFARKKKIKTLEAYPAIPYNEKVPHAFLWVGVLSSFIKNGFTVVQRNGKSRAMVRKDVGKVREESPKVGKVGKVGKVREESPKVRKVGKVREESPKVETGRPEDRVSFQSF